MQNESEDPNAEILFPVHFHKFKNSTHFFPGLFLILDKKKHDRWK